jgi:myo-inositol catabolism protein IolC
LIGIGIDHRVDFCREIIGSGDAPTAAERQRAAELKLVVLDAVARAIEAGTPKSSVIVWTDHDLGEGVLLRAKSMSLAVAVSVEKPGAGLSGLALDSTAEAWGAVMRLGASHAAVRLPYNFADPVALKQNLQEQLRLLQTKCKDAGVRLMIELTPHPTDRQLTAAGGAVTPVLRAQLLIEGMRELQDAGIEPSTWVLAPPTERLGAATVAAQAHVDGRSGVSVLFEVATEPTPVRTTSTLARGDRALAKLAARTAGVSGMLVGPDIYFATLLKLSQGEVERQDAVSSIASQVKKLWEVFADSKKTADVA